MLGTGAPLLADLAFFGFIMDAVCPKLDEFVQLATKGFLQLVLKIGFRPLSELGGNQSATSVEYRRERENLALVAEFDTGTDYVQAADEQGVIYVRRFSKKPDFVRNIDADTYKLNAFGRIAFLKA